MLRLTGGEFRGRLIQAPKGLQTRPSQAKLRQALFNSIQVSVPDAQVADLFAGSGSLGFEALSRGAAFVTYVESAASVVKMLEINAAELEVRDRIQIIKEPMERALKKIESLGPFDLILADPPYAAGWEEKLVYETNWETLLRPGGLFCLEWGVQKSQVKELPEKVPFLVKVREKNYGDSVLTTYLRESE